MSVTARAQVPTLPEELAGKIVQLLVANASCRDVCSAALACKEFSEWADTLSFVLARSPYTLGSLLLFQARRKLKV